MTKGSVEDSNSNIAVDLKRLIKLEYLAMGGSLLPKKQVHSLLAGKHSSRLRGRGLDFEEVRKYSRGDDVRNIDWRVTARTRIPHTKVFNEEKERPVFTIVDQSSFMFFGSVQYTKSVIAAEAAAISGFRTLKIGDRFGGIVFNDETSEYIAPKRSRNAVLRYLESVVRFNQQLPERKKVISNKDRLNENLLKAVMTVTHDYVVVVISDFSDMDDTTIAHLIKLSMHNDVILVHITDPLDSSLPDRNLILSDGDLQFNWKGKDKDLEGSYKAHQSKVHEILEGQLRKYRMASMFLDTTDSTANQLKEVFARISNARG